MMGAMDAISIRRVMPGIDPPTGTTTRATAHAPRTQMCTARASEADTSRAIATANGTATGAARLASPGRSETSAGVENLLIHASHPKHIVCPLLNQVSPGGLLLSGPILFTVLAELAAQSPSPAGPATAVDVASLKVRVVVSKYQGDKRVSATPFEMSVRSDGAKAQLRMGNEVPVPFVKVGTDPKQTDVPAGSLSYNYRPVGTNIDATASPGANGRFRLDILLEDSSVVLDKSEPAPMPALAGAPIFRSFRTTNTLLLRDGESTEFTAATDTITGDTIRVTVSLAVMK